MAESNDTNLFNPGDNDANVLKSVPVKAWVQKCKSASKGTIYSRIYVEIDKEWQKVVFFELGAEAVLANRLLG